MTISTLPLDTLCLSKLNVRRTERDADIAALADDIAARGLKQNLVVVPAHFSTGEVTEGWGEKWEVIAGGRRYQAMMLLVADGRLPADHQVPCLIEDRDDASETSLSENLHKVSMNPADEFAAFSTIVAEREKTHGDTRDAAIAHCAKRFGKTVNHVEGRLRLSTLAPEILDALRGDKIGLEAAKAYAVTADHDLQRKVFAQIEKDSWRSHDPRSIRSEIRGKTLPLDAPLVNFVGLVTYQAEGGRIEGEMFMGAEGQQRVVDVPLLEKLAAKIADAAMPGLAKADGFKSGMFAKGISRNATLPKAPAGFERAYDYGETPSKAKLKKSIAVYAITVDGGALGRIGRFKPSDETKKAVETRDWEAERRANQRALTIERQAAVLARPSIEGTPFEGLFFAPTYHWSVQECDDDHAFLPVWIKVPIADIEAKRAEAERLVDEAEQQVQRDKLIADLKAEREAAQNAESAPAEEPDVEAAEA